MSGDPRLRNPQPVVSHERECFQPFVQSLGLSELSVAEQAAHLLNMPWEELVKSEFNMRVFPSESNGFVRLEYDLEGHKRQASKHFGWCKSFMVGDCAQDVSGVLYTLYFLLSSFLPFAPSRSCSHGCPHQEHESDTELPERPRPSSGHLQNQTGSTLSELQLVNTSLRERSSS
jgi:hypothetical protein